MNVPLIATAMVEEDVVSLPFVKDDNNDGDEDEGIDTGTAVAGFAGGSIENRSLLFNGSNADCEDKLSTELQLIERVESSSA